MMEMPVQCSRCGDLIELNDSHPSDYEHPITASRMECEPCHRKAEQDSADPAPSELPTSPTLGVPAAFESTDTLTPAPKDHQSGDNSCGEGCRPGLHGPLCSETESFRPEEEHDCAVCEISAELAEERIAHQATSEELTRLKADMRIRQGALADVLGVPRHDDPTSYYANIEAVADLRRRDLDRTRTAPAEEPGETLRAWPKTPDDPANLDAVQEGQQ